MEYPNNLPFNPKPPTIMHIDMNSCFATVEQQANKMLRNRPIAVAAYKSLGGCIIAPSIEAKKLGIKVGMRVKEGKMIYPKLVVLEPDPWKYRNVHLKIKDILSTYTNDISPKSIDEFVIDLEGFPSMRKGIENVALEIKKRIKKEVGDYITVSIGIAPNRFLAKTAAGLKKPDGLDIINSENHLKIYSNLELPDLCGIKSNNTVRLNKAGIFSVLDFYNASARKLRTAFNSIVGYYWYMRLRGWEPDDVISNRQSFGNSVALYENLKNPEELSPILMKLVEKMSRRMRRAGYTAHGVHVSLVYKTGSHWHQGKSIKEELFSPGDVYKIAHKILLRAPYREPVHIIAVSCFNLKKSGTSQLDIFEKIQKKRELTKALDDISEKWGDFVITPAMMLDTKDIVKDRISFGGVKDLEDFINDKKE
jgi:DNA polymerase-4